MSKPLSVLMVTALVMARAVAAQPAENERAADISVSADIAPPSQAAPEAYLNAYIVVTHAEVDGNSVARDVLASIFLMERTRWGSGTKITVVEQSMSSPVRARFSREVLERSPREMLAHWRDAMRSGRRPPRVKPTDAEVLQYVASTPGAIGYVSGTAPVSSVPVKLLAIRPDS